MGDLSAWSSLLVGLLAYCGAMVLHAFLFGNRTGKVENDVAANKERIDSLTELTYRMKSVLEIYTGVSVDGIDVKPRRGGD
jgi:hypothetical protein